MVSRTESGTTRISWLNEWTLHTHWSGTGTGELVVAAEERILTVLETRAARFLVCDTLDVVGYDGSVHRPAQRLLISLKRRGVAEMIVVASPGPIRMLGFALGLLGRVPTRVLPDEQGAIDYCNGMRSYNNIGQALPDLP